MLLLNNVFSNLRLTYSCGRDWIECEELLIRSNQLHCKGERVMSDQRNPDKHSPFESQREDHENRDPITGTPGAHPVGAGIGAIGGAAAGAAIGTAAGPLGTVVGAAIGGVAGGLVGKGV